MNDMQQPPEQGTDLIAILNRENAQFNRWLEDPDDILFNVGTILRGQVPVPILGKDGKTIERYEYKKKLKPKMNEQGVNEVLYFLYQNINKNTNVSNVNEKEVYRDIRTTSLQFQRIVMLNRKNWELDLKFYPTLILTIENALWFSFNRPKDQGERVFLRKTYSESTSKLIQDQPKKEGGLLPNLNPFSKKE